MRAYWIAAAAIAAVAVATPAEAQRGPRGGHWSGPRTTPMPARPQGWRGGNWHGPRSMPGHPRWGGRVNGRWYAGVYAPGGWAAYRRPVRGWVLPRYWFAPTFYITDFAGYGLGAPPYGYNWVRYYDDAVLVDGGGRVYDSVGGIDWDRDDGDYAYPDDGAYAEPGAPYPPPSEHRDDGVGGAVIGGVVGGVAGNVIAGHGDKLGGTLLGAGVGALAGAAIDEAEDDRRHRRHGPPPPPPPYGAPYPEPGYPGGAYPPPPVVYAPPAEVVQPAPYDRHHVYAGGTQPYTTVVPGPYGSFTTVTVIPSVVTTTTTTEYVYEDAPVHTYRKVVRRPACKCKYVRR